MTSRVTRVLGSPFVLGTDRGDGGRSPAAQSGTSSIVRVDSGKRHGVADDGVPSVQGHPFRSAACRRSAVAATPAAGELDGRAPGREFGADCVQGRFGRLRRRRRPARRAAPAPRLPPGSELSVPERLASRRSDRPQSTSDGVDYGGGFRAGPAPRPTRRASALPSRASSLSR